MPIGADDDGRPSCAPSSSTSAPALLVDVLAGAARRPPSRRSATSTYADEARRPTSWQLDWTAPAVELDRWVRVGGAWTTFRGRRLKVRRRRAGRRPSGRAPASSTGDGVVGTGAGALRLVTVQPEGKAAMPWRDFANGARPQPGERLGD